LYDEPGFQKTYTILNKQLSNTPDFLSDYAQKLQALSRYDQSKKMLEKAVRIEPTAERLMLLGYDCEMLDFYDKAEYYYKNAIQTQPKLFRPRYLLLKLYIKLDKRTLAKDVATNILLFPVKVPSQEVKDIKMAAKNYLSGI
jgi:tetratricopeptide (TPR) repeat protein